MLPVLKNVVERSAAKNYYHVSLLSISITHKMVKMVIRNLDSSKASGLDCIPLGF